MPAGLGLFKACHQSLGWCLPGITFSLKKMPYLLAHAIRDLLGDLDEKQLKLHSVAIQAKSQAL